jgi:transposase
MYWIPSIWAHHTYQAKILSWDILIIMRLYRNSQKLEKRRRQAIRLLKKGTSLTAVARRLRVSKSSVFRWYKAYKKGGLAGLYSKPIPGRPARLSIAQKKRLTEFYSSSPKIFGYQTDRWTSKLVAQLILKHFHIRYHPNHVWRLLRGLGWKLKKLRRQALPRHKTDHP